MQGLAGLAGALLAGAQRTEVLHGLGNSISEKSHHNATLFAILNLNIEENFLGDLLKVPVFFIKRLESERIGDVGKGKCSANQFAWND